MGLFDSPQSEKDVDEAMSDDDGSDIEIVFERKGDKNGNRDGGGTVSDHSLPCSSSKRLKTEQPLRTLAEVVVASSSSSVAKSEGGDSKGKTHRDGNLATLRFHVFHSVARFPP